MNDYYGDEEGAQPRPGPDTAQSEPMDKEESENQTALIPKSLCAGHELDVGDTVTLKIVGVHDSEYEVEYGENESKEEESPPAKGEPETVTPDKPQRSRWSEYME